MDTAAIVFCVSEIPLPKEPIQMQPDGKYLKIGNEIGWLGFPAVSPFEMCFFTGRISTWLAQTRTYLVDGVAINGVSGGPALFMMNKEIMLVVVVYQTEQRVKSYQV